MGNSATPPIGPSRPGSRHTLTGTMLLALVACAGASPPGADSAPPDAPRHLELVNGLWFDGTGFSPATVYVEDGRWRHERPSVVDASLDLAGGFVIPPLAEAHTHTLVDRLERIDEFLDHGIVYAGVQNTFRSTAEQVRARFGPIGSVDVRWAITGFTASDGHPLQIGTASGRTPAQLDGDWLHLADTEADVERAWPGVRASGTDVVKVFLVNSDEYARRHGAPDVPTRHRGLDPALLPGIVSRAHADGLPVTAHVRTALDFRAALDAGVDEIAHLPGFALGPSTLEELDDPSFTREIDEPARFRLDAADASLAAERGVVVQTTVAGPTQPPPGLPAELVPRVRHIIDVARDVQAANLRLLREHGVRLAFGSDSGERDVVDEIVYLDGLGVFDRAELLRRATTDTPRSLFPGRAIGDFADGGEASLVVLRRNPLADIGAITDVALVLQRGDVVRGAAR